MASNPLFYLNILATLCIKGLRFDCTDTGLMERASADEIDYSRHPGIHSACSQSVAITGYHITFKFSIVHTESYVATENERRFDNLCELI